MSTKSDGGSTMSLSVSERKSARILYGLEELLRANLHENVEVQTIMFLLEVARNEEPIDLTSVGTKLGISKAAASRNFYKLADGKGGQGGLDLIKSLVDYQDRRRVLLVLTPKGVEVVRKITSYLAKRFGGT